MKIAIVIQGPSSNPVEQREAWHLRKSDLIFSTWIGSEHLYSRDDMVIFNEMPQIPGPMNFNCQIKSTVSGLLKAKELGYTHALKLRSDMIPLNSENFINSLNYEKINFLSWCNFEVYPKCPGYLTDFLCFGDIDRMIKLWSIDKIFCVVPEIMLTKQFIDHFNTEDVHYFLDNLEGETDLFWIKKNSYMSSYKHNVTFNKETGYLNKDYINFLTQK
jgi:hypothetical protein